MNSYYRYASLNSYTGLFCKNCFDEVYVCLFVLSLVKTLFHDLSETTKKSPLFLVAMRTLTTVV